MTSGRVGAVLLARTITDMPPVLISSRSRTSQMDSVRVLNAQISGSRDRVSQLDAVLPPSPVKQLDRRA